MGSSRFSWSCRSILVDGCVGSERLSLDGIASVCRMRA